MKNINLSAIAVLTTIGIFAGVQAASAEETVCRGTLGAVTLDNVRVPSGATCTLNRTRVQGTVKVESNATLRAVGVGVVGNIQAENARAVTVGSSSVIGGSIQIEQGGAANIANSQINGDLQFFQNRGLLVATSNRIGGNLQAFQNTGGVRINTNRINGNLQCKQNNPAPTGRGNIVQGSKEDQCARL
jgi:hypothetical protein